MKISDNEFELWDRNVLNIEARNMAKDIDNFYEEMGNLAEKNMKLKKALKRTLKAYSSSFYDDGLTNEEVEEFFKLTEGAK